MTRPPATYDAPLAVPDHCVAEIVDGELIVSPRPASLQAFATSVIGMDVGPSFHGQGGRGGPGGWWIVFEPELHLRRDVVVPDVAGWRLERMPVYPNVAYFELAPDWVCEVASPSMMRLDRVKKLHVYAREGVGHVWLVDPLAQTLECYRLENGGWFVAGTFGGNDKVRVEPFEALEIDLERWWPPSA